MAPVWSTMTGSVLYSSYDYRKDGVLAKLGHGDSMHVAVIDPTDPASDFQSLRGQPMYPMAGHSGCGNRKGIFRRTGDRGFGALHDRRY